MADHARNPSGRSRYLKAVGLASASLLASLAGPAFAQSEGTAAPQDSSAETDPVDIVVTAQKREERLQDVPISIAVLDGEALSALNFNEATDLQYLVPGVQVLNAAGPRSFGFYIRGVGTTSFSSESVEGSVAYVVDGVVMGQAGASLTDLPDIERVEVLRGPQGTLFGKNASAGVINIVTRRPSETWEARVSGSWAGPDNERKLSGLVSGPISDNVRILLSGRLNKRDGIVENVFDGRDLNNRNDYGFRGRVEAEFGNLTTNLIGDWWQRRSDCCIWTLRSLSATPNALELSQLDAGIVPSPRNERQNINGMLQSDIDSWGVSLANDLELGGSGYIVTAITAYRNWHTIDGLDTDSRPTNIYDLNYADFQQEQFTQELRLTSPTGGLVDFVAGLFYFHSNVTSVSFQDNRASTAAFAAREVTNDASTDNYAIFGQANINLSPDFRLIAGARWLSETANATKFRLDTRDGATSLDRQRKTDDGFVWRLGAQYDLSPDANVFATVTRGFKAGGFDTGIGFPELTNVDPEIPTSMEAGLRTSWPEIGLTFNVTAFHLIVDDYQISGRVPNQNQSIYRLINAATLESNGVEVDFSWRPVRNVDFLLSGSAALMDAKFKRFPNAQCWAGQTLAQGCDGGTQDISGTRVPQAPKFSWNLMANYSTDVTDALRLHFDFDANYRSRAGKSFPISPFVYQDGYALLNAAIGISDADESWRLSLFGRNLADQHFANNIASTVLGSAPGSTQQYPIYEARRVIGFAFDVRF